MNCRLDIEKEDIVHGEYMLDNTKCEFTVGTIIIDVNGSNKNFNARYRLNLEPYGKRFKVLMFRDYEHNYKGYSIKNFVISNSKNTADMLNKVMTQIRKDVIDA